MPFIGDTTSGFFLRRMLHPHTIPLFHTVTHSTVPYLHFQGSYFMLQAFSCIITCLQVVLAVSFSFSLFIYDGGTSYLIDR